MSGTWITFLVTTCIFTSLYKWVKIHVVVIVCIQNGQILNMFDVKLTEICVRDFLNVRFGVSEDLCLLKCDTLLLGKWFLTF